MDRGMLARALVTLGLVALAPIYAGLLDSRAGPDSGLGLDFRTFKRSAESWVESGDVYPRLPRCPRPVDPNCAVHNLNPPHAAIAIYGWTAGEDYRTAFIAFSAVAGLLTLAGIVFVVASVRADWWAVPALALALLGSFPTLVALTSKGQLGPPLLFPLAVAWWLLTRRHRAAAGVALGIAFAVKLFVGLFLPVLLLARRTRAAASMAATAAGIYLAGIVVFGWDQYVENVRLIREETFHLASWAGNLSILGTASRLANGVEGAVLPLSHPGVLVPTLAVVAWVCWAAWRGRSAGELMAVTVVGMLLVAPLAWYYYLPLLVIPLVVAWRHGGWVRWAAAGAWVVSAGTLETIPVTWQVLGITLMLGAMVAMTVTDPSPARRGYRARQPG